MLDADKMVPSSSDSCYLFTTDLIKINRIVSVPLVSTYPNWTLINPNMSATTTAELPNAATGSKTVSIPSVRIQSIDLLRGIVIMLMALDHVRDYFHADAFIYNPLDLSQTNAPLFVTRWVTHFCAPVFVFLAGTSGFLVGNRKGKKELSMFLLKRGVWLIVLEFTVINFAWFFNIEFPLIALTVIWALGIGMIILAGAIYLPFNAILALGLAMVFGHNLLDGIHATGKDLTSFSWSVLHEPGLYQFGHFTVFVGYPIIPWAGIMMLGYCMGQLYLPGADAQRRKQLLLRIGVAAMITLVVIRMFTTYGDPREWTIQPTAVFSFLSFVNFAKYPPSLLYVLATLGPALVFLSLSEKLTGRFPQYIIALGRVPLFFYIVHILFIHLLGLVAVALTGYDLSDMVFNTWVTDSPNLKGYGFSLLVTYAVWIFVIAVLFPLCLWYDRYKTKYGREKAWLSYM